MATPSATMPGGIASAVVISTRPLPPIRARGSSTRGGIEYLIGANTLACTPIRNSTTHSNRMLCSQKPSVASSVAATPGIRPGSAWPDAMRCR
ncbi:MAG: hypothetical protein ACYDCY_08395 [Metallibacterium sp.]